MAPLRTRALVVLALAVAASALATMMLPSRHMASSRAQTPLAEWIPARLATWTEDRDVPLSVPPPDLQASLSRVYQDLLARTYANPQGYRVMVSIAYSGDQSDGLAVHRPEVCYPAQGFEIMRLWDDTLVLGDRRIPIRRATTRNAARLEPLTYWIVNGDHVVASIWDGRLRQLKSTLGGTVPDGLLVRLSSLDDNPERAFAMQDALAREIVAAVDAGFRARLAGQRED